MSFSELKQQLAYSTVKSRYFLWFLSLLILPWTFHCSTGPVILNKNPMLSPTVKELDEEDNPLFFNFTKLLFIFFLTFYFHRFRAWRRTPSSFPWLILLLFPLFYCKEDLVSFIFTTTVSVFALYIIFQLYNFPSALHPNVSLLQRK